MKLTINNPTYRVLKMLAERKAASEWPCGEASGRKRRSVARSGSARSTSSRCSRSVPSSRATRASARRRRCWPTHAGRGWDELEREGCTRSTRARSSEEATERRTRRKEAMSDAAPASPARGWRRSQWRHAVGARAREGVPRARARRPALRLRGLHPRRGGQGRAGKPAATPLTLTLTLTLTQSQIQARNPSLPSPRDPGTPAAEGGASRGERRQRDAFRELLRSKQRDGLLHARTQWRELVRSPDPHRNPDPDPNPKRARSGGSW